MTKYSTTAGVPTRHDAYSKLMHHLEEAADQAAVLSHLANTEDTNRDKLIAKGWLVIHELILRMKEQVRLMVVDGFKGN